MRDFVSLNSEILEDIDPSYSIGGWYAMGNFLGYFPREEDFLKVYSKNELGYEEKLKIEERLGFKIFLINEIVPTQDIGNVKFILKEKYVAEKLNSIYNESFPPCKSIYDLFFLLEKPNFRMYELEKYIEIKNLHHLKYIDIDYFEKFQRNTKFQIPYKDAIDKINNFADDVLVKII